MPHDVVSRRLETEMELVTTSSVALVVEMRLKQCMYESTQHI
jgi:hypothetical protein